MEGVAPTFRKFRTLKNCSLFIPTTMNKKMNLNNLILQDFRVTYFRKGTVLHFKTKNSYILEFPSYICLTIYIEGNVEKWGIITFIMCLL